MNRLRSTRQIHFTFQGLQYWSNVTIAKHITVSFVPGIEIVTPEVSKILNARSVSFRRNMEALRRDLDAFKEILIEKYKRTVEKLENLSKERFLLKRERDELELARFYLRHHI